jgi:DNA polymerase V
MMIFLHNSPFDSKEQYFSRQASFQLPHPTSDSAELIHHACTALTRIFRPGIHYNKCGVMLTELTPDTDHQGDFLDMRNRARSKQLMAALDAINRRMGQGTVFYAASGVKRDWAMARTIKSQHFTTDWQQLITVRA